MKTQPFARMKHVLLFLLVCLLCGNTVIRAQNFNEVRQETAQNEEAVLENPSVSLNSWDYFLYPVPANDEVNIKITKGHVSIQQINIVDESGNEVFEMENLSTEKMKINISDLPPGKYFIQVRPEQDSPLKMKRFYVSN
ncbi:MAG: T9SS type A sorting domain-containing protein [Bacteroidetes bacterium]|nr:T9SS type A sorting domain-containing protein [Bacteroidota bacterium]